MLEQDRVAAQRRIEDADAPGPLDGDQEQRDRHTGVPSNWIRLVAYSDQTNSGSRLQVIPGHRILWMVTMMFSPVMIELNPVMNTPTTPGNDVACDARVL